MDDRPDVIAIAVAQGCYDEPSFEAGYRLAVNAKMLAEVAGLHADARFTTLRALVPSIEALAASVGYGLDVEDIGEGGVLVTLLVNGDVATPSGSSGGSDV